MKGLKKTLIYSMIVFSTTIVLGTLLISLFYCIQESNYKDVTSFVRYKHDTTIVYTLLPKRSIIRSAHSWYDVKVEVYVPNKSLGYAELNKSFLYKWEYPIFDGRHSVKHILLYEKK